MNKIKVSIIIPMLNSVKYLEECLKSVRNQSLKDIEIICVDAGSTDGTLELINSYANKDERISIINSDKKSYGVQMNKGIEAAKGEYVAIFESDDYASPEMFANLYNKTFDNKPDFVKGGYVQFCDIFGKRVSEEIVKKDRNIGKLITLGDSPEYRLFDYLSIWSGIYKKDFLDKNNICLNESPGASYQDAGFSMLVALLAETCIYTNDCGYNYRIDNVNSSVKDESKISCIVDEYDFINKELMERQILDRNIAVVNQHRLYGYFWNYKRLSTNGKRKFLEIIKTEIKSYVDKNDDFAKKNHEILFYLSDINNEVVYNKNEKSKYDFLDKISKIANENQKCVCVSAGVMGARFLNMQNLLGVKFIDAVCDNSKTLHGQKIGDYSIASFEEVSINYSNNLFIICNKKYGQEMKEQLIALGISADKVIVLDDLLNLQMTVNYIISIPKISIIMPSLNVGAYIEQCITSVLNQTFSNIEVLCIDAGSTDGTLEILEEYAKKDNRIKIINSEVKSYGYQMNLGISNARGEYIGIVETDDIIESDMFETLYHMTKANKPDYVKGNAVEFQENNEEKCRLRQIYPYEDFKNSNEYSIEINPSKRPEIFVSDNFLWNGIYRADFLKKISFQETPGAAFQDISALFQIISTAQKAIYINKMVYLYRQDNLNASSYNKKSLIYTNIEYARIIDSLLGGLTDDWVKICYKKMMYLTLNRFEIMAQSKEYWYESESGIDGITEKFKYALKSEILIKGDFFDTQWKRINQFVENPKELFEDESKFNIFKNQYIDSIKNRIGSNKYIVVGFGAWGKYIAKELQRNYKISPEYFWDNDSSKWGEVENKVICEAPGKTNDKSMTYVIANKKYYDELREQLIGLNINEEQLVEFNFDMVKNMLDQSNV